MTYHIIYFTLIISDSLQNDPSVLSVSALLASVHCNYDTTVMVQNY